MTTRTSSLAFLIAVLCNTLPGLSQANQEQLYPQAYFGAALGSSTLSPKSDLQQKDDEDGGFKILFGYDLTERGSVELHLSDLGKTSFTGGGSLGYQTYGVEYLHNVYASRGIDGYEFRQGFMAFLKVGLGFMRNSGKQLDFKREHDLHLSLGAGLGASITEKTRIRLEFNAFDTDAHLLSLALVQRFGGVPAWPFRNPTPAAPIEPVVPVLLPEPEPEPEAEIFVPSDVDHDGVDDSRDLCPATSPDRRVDESGCVFGGIMDGVQFELNSATLTLPATARLDAVIQDMQRYPKLRVQITAHTDNQGSGAYNLQLSIKRARAVAEYLVEHGISPDRLRAIGAGESQPIYRNDNESGRQRNRRVDFKVLNY